MDFGNIDTCKNYLQEIREATDYFNARETALAVVYETIATTRTQNESTARVLRKMKSTLETSFSVYNHWQKLDVTSSEISKLPGQSSYGTSLLNILDSKPTQTSVFSHIAHENPKHRGLIDSKVKKTFASPRHRTSLRLTRVEKYTPVDQVKPSVASFSRQDKDSNRRQSIAQQRIRRRTMGPQRPQRRDSAAPYSQSRQLRQPSRLKFNRDYPKPWLIPPPPQLRGPLKPILETDTTRQPLKLSMRSKSCTQKSHPTLMNTKTINEKRIKNLMEQEIDPSDHQPRAKLSMISNFADRRNTSDSLQQRLRRNRISNFDNNGVYRRGPRPSSFERDHVEDETPIAGKPSKISEEETLSSSTEIITKTQERPIHLETTSESFGLATQSSHIESSEKGRVNPADTAYQASQNHWMSNIGRRSSYTRAGQRRQSDLKEKSISASVRINLNNDLPSRRTSEIPKRVSLLVPSQPIDGSRRSSLGAIGRSFTSIRGPESAWGVTVGSNRQNKRNLVTRRHSIHQNLNTRR